MESGERPYQDLALVDVELFVASGVPRSEFELLPRRASSPTVPRFRIYDSSLRRLGWVSEGLNGPTLQPPPDAPVDVESAHPYDLGPSWEGANCWHAAFSVDGGTVRAFVDHVWSGSVRLDCDAGPALVSGSPWRWRIDGLPGGTDCGRAENPVLAAVAVEEVVMAASSWPFTRTATWRRLPDQLDEPAAS
jgi:hypothetical protein